MGLRDEIESDAVAAKTSPEQRARQDKALEVAKAMMIFHLEEVKKLNFKDKGDNWGVLGASLIALVVSVADGLTTAERRSFTRSIGEMLMALEFGKMDGALVPDVPGGATKPEDVRKLIMDYREFLDQDFK